jgi:hypothetical protein
MTIGNMRDNDVRSPAVSCWLVILSADSLAQLPVPPRQARAHPQGSCA